MDYAAPEWSEANTLFVKCWGRNRESPIFTIEEIDAIRIDIVKALGVAENIVATEGRMIKPGVDSDDIIRRYLHLDRGAAIKRWTIPSPGWPDVEEERLFQCWKCGEDHSIDGFEESEFDVTRFDRLLGRYALRGSLQWCMDCDKARHLKWTESAAKRLKRE
jgi:hypothetical protein